MAAKKPSSKPEMLDVSGVGENKYAKYGERFLSKIEECTEDYPELLQNKEEADRYEETEVKSLRKRNDRKKEFFLLQEEADNFAYADLLKISAIRDEMNRICERDDIKKLPVTSLTGFLVSEGLIIEKEQEGSRGKFPTEKGFELGIQAIDKVSEKGNAYTLLMYPADVQRMLVEHYIGD